MAPLTGRPRLLFLAVWWTMLVAASIAMMASLPATYRYITTVPPAINLGLTTMNGVNLGPAVNSVAAKTGIANGDLLVAVDGRPVTEVDWATVDRLLDGPVGSQVTLAIRKPSGERVTRTLTRDPELARRALRPYALFPGASRWAFGLLNLISYSLVPWVCAFLLMLRRGRDTLAPWTSLCCCAVQPRLPFFRAADRWGDRGWPRSP
jgi:membrane-associated protease RseP (regulator of RpoE activity)